ncbi:DIS3-like exonuclease 2 [Trinorchestia longiramus]|nr:DIS3-like exonuclease 2 [Trinorchestia longiramus]
MVLRIRNQEGSGLTIRIPRPLSDRGTSPPATSTTPPPVPRYAQLTTSRYAHMAPHTGAALYRPGSAAPVPKSKSLSTSMDKLPYGVHLSPSSRGSTPSSGRSSAATSASRHSITRRSPSVAAALGSGGHCRAQQLSNGSREKSHSPCGSEVSLNSGVSSTTSVKSLPSVRSSSSASGRSSSGVPKAVQPRSTIRRSPSSPAAASSVRGSPKSTSDSKIGNGGTTQSREKPEDSSPKKKSSTKSNGASMNGTKISSNGVTVNGSKVVDNGLSNRSPIVGTHRKNAVVTRPPGIMGSKTQSPSVHSNDDACSDPQNPPTNSIGHDKSAQNSDHLPPSPQPSGKISPASPAHPSSPGSSTTAKRRAASCSTSSLSNSPSPATSYISRRSYSRRMSAMCDASNRQQSSSAKKGLPVFNSYMSLFQVQEKLKKGEVIEGVLRINPKNYEDAYISAPGGGTDIYIGGVRDRNAALHGDVVALELLPPEEWKVLYDQLDYFLDTDDTLKSLVYASHDAFATMDQFIPPGCAAPVPAQPSQDEPKPANDKENDPTTNTDSAPSTTQKKKKKRRGKKNKDELLNNDIDGMGAAAAAAEVVAGMLADPPPQNTQDELYLLSSAGASGAVVAPTMTVTQSVSKKKQPAVVVPPDMLSECSDITDDESCCSDSLDLDTAMEDRGFYNAQRAAANKAKRGGLGVAVFPDDLTGMRLANIVELPDDATEVKTEVSVKVEGSDKAPAEQQASSPGQVTVSPGGDASASKKKRKTTVERLFGDKIKNKTPEKDGSQEQAHANKDEVEEVKDSVSNLSISGDSKKFPDIVGAKEILSTVDGSQANAVTNSMTNEYSGFGGAGVEPSTGFVGMPPRFMISPYNKQVNFNPNQSRAENNWLHHPMLNSFSNSPASNPAVVGSQHQHRSQNRHQQPRQNQQRQPNNQQPPVEKRTEPSVSQVMRLANWSRFIQKVGYVVHILEQRNTRLAAGTLKPFQDLNPNFALFSPNDSRIPRMKIPMNQCPPDLIARRNDYAKRIHLAKITMWNDPKFALGCLISDIGRQGDILAESDAFLLQIGIDSSEFPEEVVAQLPPTGWTIPPETLKCRKDLRDHCILTIDPPTARDLDDALSCEPLPNGNFRVGVHIADVSYFVPLDSELDKIAASRGTSVYLIDRVISMLPRKLCENLCSLNPDEDRLAFSVIWDMDPEGNVESCWFGRTVIRSCAKLSYEHAQRVIDYPEQTEWSHDELPVNRRFSSGQVSVIINTLYKLSVEMRRRRHMHGALRLDQRKLGFSLDPKTKKPNAVHNIEHLASNSMIEEFMLMANISVAHKIYETFPKHAVLRCHPAPQQGQLEDIVNMLRTLNIEIDSSSAGAIYASVLELSGEDSYSLARLEVIVNLLSKPMQNALYFCSGTYEEDFCHYALNVPFYTHFTSPIRRYPDIMVHRLLAAAVDSSQYSFPNLELKEIDRRLACSNEKKVAAKRASEYSAELFLAEFIRQVKEVTTSGMVIGVLDRSLDILLLDYCTIKRTYLERLPLDELNYDNKNKQEPPTVHIVWSPDHAKQIPAQAQSLTYFTCVKVLLTPFVNDQLKINVTLVRPDS